MTPGTDDEARKIWSEGNWLLVRNRKGMEWHVPFPELRPNTPNV